MKHGSPCKQKMIGKNCCGVRSRFSVWLEGVSRSVFYKMSEFFFQGLGSRL